MVVTLAGCVRPAPVSNTPQPAPAATPGPVSSYKDWDSFVAGWRARVAAKNGSAAALALYDAAVAKPDAPDAAGLAAATERAIADGDEWGEAICRLDAVQMLYPKIDVAAGAVSLGRAAAITQRLIGEENGAYPLMISIQGLLMKQQGDLAGARPLYEKVVAINERVLGPDHPDFGTVLNNLALLYKQMGDFAGARQVYERALAVRTKAHGPDHEDVAQSLNNLASLLEAQGDYEAARPMYERALSNWEKRLGPEHPEVAAGLNNIAELDLAEGKTATARPLLVRAVAIWEKALGADVGDTGFARFNLARLDYREGRFADARVGMERAEATFTKAFGPQAQEVAIVQTQRAWVLLHEGKLAEAARVARASLELREKIYGPSHHQVAESLNVLAAIHQRQGKTSVARGLYERAAKLNVAHVDHVLGASSDREKALAVAKLGDVSMALDLAVANGNDEWASWAFELVTEVKGRSLDALAVERATSRADLDGDARKAFDELRAARASLAALALKRMKPAQEKDRQAGMETLRVRIEELERTVAQTSRRYASERAARRATPAEICAALAGDEALVEMLVHEPQPVPPAKAAPRLLALVVTRATTARCKTSAIDLGPVEPIARAVGAWREQLAADTRLFERGLPLGNARKLDDLGRAASALVWAPLEKKLPRSGRVLLAPDGPLHSLPFGALPGAKAGTYLVESRPLTVIASGRDLLRARTADGADGRALAVVDPAYGATAAPITVAAMRGLESCPDLRDARWAPLPETKAEVARLEEAWPARVDVLAGDAATVEAFRAQAAGKRRLHLATHGYFVPRGCGSTGGMSPLLASGLVLAGANGGRAGYLTALDVADLDLSAAELVVLSACESGLGEIERGEGVAGLQRAFALAGAGSLVLSLYRVPSEETASLMKSFYAGLDAKGARPSDALRAAQRARIAELRASRGHAHPLFWGGFVAVGR